ncbi:hypothetical protein ABZ942_12670 [Nocardia sp. NPDC046473]|uniref:hypothetical protein n=1 Tax=Nocardia sp. NPDC046473 TaxID=3155733 RepID=UPI003404B962
MAVTHAQQKRFGRLIKARRMWLNMTRDDVHDAGGPADTTLARIEDPGPDTAPPRPKTLRGLDNSLRMVPGSAARALNGGELEALADTPQVADPDGPASNPLTFRAVTVDVSVVQSLVAAAEAYDQFCARPDLSEAAAAAAHAIREQLGIAVGKVAAAHATEVLERVGGPGRALPAFIELAYGQYLSAPPTATGADLEDQLYRRWLAGRAADLDPAHVATFTSRWRSKLQHVRLSERGGHQ